MDTDTERILTEIAASGPITKQALVKKTKFDGAVVDAALKTLAKQKIIACVTGTRSWQVTEGNLATPAAPADVEPNLSPNGPLYPNPKPKPPEKFDEDTLEYIRLRSRLGDPLDIIADRLEVPAAMVYAAMGQLPPPPAEIQLEVA